MQAGMGRGYVIAILVGAVFSCFPNTAPAATSSADLKSINAALITWLVMIDSDESYLLLDSEKQEVRLMQQKSILRSCPANIDSLTFVVDVDLKMEQSLRRYWRTPGDIDSYENLPKFDWENHLSADGDDDCALWFTGGLLFYSSPMWGSIRAPSVQLQPRDIRALYNVTRKGMRLVILPRGWNSVIYPETGPEKEGSNTMVGG